MHAYFWQWDSFNALSLSCFHKAMGFFQCPFIVMASQGSGVLSMPCHCHGFTGQWGSFNVFSLSWFHRAAGFFQCPSLIVMVSQGSGILSMSVIVMASRGNGILSMSFHCHRGVLSMSVIVMVSQGSGILSMSVIVMASRGNEWDSFNVLSLSWLHRAGGF